ncbi:PREDICTED: uncharacterized protein LOC109172842 [Ipomoea nil]|uniref:uncharacterized protein LOC109172842 n=1 Tax=Ipomoea nil TaxID=35883 RepID=UPI00090092A8|nr:PREDICTED: uncharacterized protein LOC109172842 [Ipomoea nil]
MRQETQTSFKNIEIQMAHLIKLVTERPSGSLPSTTENNQRERANSISIHPESEPNIITMERETSVKGKVMMKYDDAKDTKTKARVVTSRYRPQTTNRTINLAEMEQRDKFNALLRKLYINMPLPHTLKDLPRSKEPVVQKKEIHNESHAHMSVVCSDVLEKGCHRKNGGPGLFVVSCVINNYVFKNALADLGASANVMPSCIADKLKMHGMTLTRMTIQLADGTTRYPLGIMEDVLVKIENSIILMDFVVLNVGPELKEVPLIFERSFLPEQ